MNYLFLMGTAGSGKSAMALALSERIKSSDADVALLNLDAGVRWLPYAPDSDIRDYVDYAQLAEEYKLGPNGALVASVDAAVGHVSEMKAELERLDPEFVIVDTPGQMELFAYRDAGTLIASELAGDDFSTVFLADSIFLNRASDFISILLLSYSVQARFRAPQINCISKIDLLPKDLLERAIMWSSDPDTLINEFMSQRSDEKMELSMKLLESMLDSGALGEFIFTSSNTGEGLDDLYAQIQRIHSGGEDR